MRFSMLFVLLSWISLIPCPTRAQDGGRELYFPSYYFYAQKHLVNHWIKTITVKDLDECEYRCYLDANCVSLNIRNKDPNGTHECELNNSTHVEHESHLKDYHLYYYRGAENKCRKNGSRCENKSTCQSGFTQKGYRCSCTAGFEGEYCGEDVDECNRGSHKCHLNAVCNNTNGGYNCFCKDGYSGDGHNCTDIDECATGSNKACGNKRHSECSNTEGSFKCPCAFGYVSNDNGKTCEVDGCHHYQNLTDAERKYDHDTKGNGKCDDNLYGKGWYRFQGDAGTKMATKSPGLKKCGAAYPVWLKGVHPTVAEGTVKRIVCINKKTECDKQNALKVKNCTSYYIYKFFDINDCPFRYCGTD